MKKNNKLAIIIPYYKKDFLDQCLQSLSHQTCKDFSVYIGNDDSPNDPQDVINEYKDQLTIFYKKFDANLGGKNLTQQWDRCIEMSKEEPWIMILGDDDELSSNCIEKFYENLLIVEEKNIQVIKFATIEIDEKNKEISKKYINPQFEKSTTAYYKKLIGEGRSSLSEYVFSRTSYNKYGFKEFPLAFGSDNLAWIEFSECGPIYAINDAVVFFRLSPVNISGNNLFQKQNKLYAMFLTKRYLLNNYAQFFSKDEKKEIIKQAIINLNASKKKVILEKVLFLILTFKWLNPLQIISIYKNIYTT